MGRYIENIVINRRYR